jgi:hypothetical protein
MSSEGNSDSRALVAARDYTRRGWSVVPIPFRSKNPGFNAWEQLRLKEPDLGDRFSGGPQNIGVMLGEPSQWLIDVDLDHLRAVARAPEFLPPTPARFGRASNPNSHWLYQVTAPVATKKFRSKSAGMIVELRSTGMQTVFPGSVHESGEPIKWDDPGAEPAEIDPVVLLAATTALANAVKVDLGERAQRPQSKEEQAPKRDTTGSAGPGVPDADDLLVEGGRNDALTSIAGRLRAEGAEELEIVAALKTVNAQRCRPPLEESEVEGIARSVSRYPPGRNTEHTVEPDEEPGLIPLGERDPETGRLVLSPKRTVPTAEAYLRDFHRHPEGRTFHSYAGLLLHWQHNRFVEVERGAILQRLQHWLHRALRYVVDRRTQLPLLVNFESNPTSVHAALATLEAEAHLPATTPMPGWLTDRSGDPPASEICPARPASGICRR